jgi:hypothetical protein
MKMLRGGRGTEIYSGIKGAGSESSEGGYKRFKVLVQQGPGVFTPTIVNKWNRWFGNSLE